jgi:hypothetical protein
MTKKRPNKMVLKDNAKMTPPKGGGRQLLRGFIPYEGTQDEEIEALRMVFRMDGSNPYKDDAINIYKPVWDAMNQNT